MNMTTPEGNYKIVHNDIFIFSKVNETKQANNRNYMWMLQNEFFLLFFDLN